MAMGYKYVYPCRDRFGKTPLHLAADKGYADIISLLTEADAPLEAKDKDGVSAWAVMVGCTMHLHIQKTCSVSYSWQHSEVFIEVTASDVHDVMMTGNIFDIHYMSPYASTDNPTLLGLSEGPPSSC